MEKANDFRVDYPYNLAPFTVRVEPNFITVPHLSGSWLDLMEVRWDNCSMMIVM